MPECFGAAESAGVPAAVAARGSAEAGASADDVIGYAKARNAASAARRASCEILLSAIFNVKNVIIDNSEN